MKKSFDKKLYEKYTKDEVKKMNLAQKFINIKSLDMLGDSEAEKFSLQIFETINFVRKNKTSMTLLQIFEKIKTSFLLNGFDDEFEFLQGKNNIKILEKITDDFCQNTQYLSIKSLLDYIEKISEDKNFELPSVSTEEMNAVQILTIHASKGLEFPYVFVLSIASSAQSADKSSIVFDMQYGEKPGFGLVINKYKGKPNPKVLLYKKLWQKPREQNEALRLFYVAVSRAKKYLNVLSFEPYSSVKPVEYIENFAKYLALPE